jgi:flagellar motor switch protein FliM
MPSESGRSAVVPPDRDLHAALPFVETCFRGVARRIRARLVNRTGVDTIVQASAAYAQPAGTLIDNPELADAMWCPFRMDRGELRGFAAVQGQLLARLIGRLFGEGATAELAPYQPRPVTEVEITIGTRLCTDVYAAIEEYWPVRSMPRIVPEPAGGSHHVLGEFPPTAPMIVCDLHFGRPEASLGRLIVALPTGLLRDLVARRSPQPDKKPAPRPVKFDRLMPVEVEVVIQVAKIELNLSTLENLAVGDEIPLGSLSDARAIVNGRPAFSGEPGTKGSMRSFRITRRLIGPANSSPGAPDR